MKNPQSVYDPETQRELEYIVLLLLGSSKRKELTILHLEKELFFLWNASEHIQPLLEFIAHYRGPFSKALADTAKFPMFLDEHWEYHPPRGSNDISGGSIKLNHFGKEEYDHILDKIHSNDNKKLIHILAAMALLHDLYDNLTLKELLYLLYTNPKYEDYIKKSQVYYDVVTPRIKKSLVQKLGKPLINEPLGGMA